MANYIAKYATKTLTVPGVPDKRLRTAFDLQGLRCSAHYQRMITTAWQLGAPGAGPRRTCSATAATSSPNPAAIPSPSAPCALPAPATAAPRTTRTANATLGPALDETVVLVMSTWTYAGTGYTGTPGNELALASAARAREHRGQAGAAA